MTTTMTTAEGVLKEIYGPRVADQLNSETFTLKRIERTSDGVNHDAGGKYVTFPIRVERNHGIGARDEMDPLPDAQATKWLNPRVNLTYQYGSIRITGQVFHLAERNPQSFVSTVDAEIEGLKENLLKDVNRQIYGYKLGTLATASGGSTNTFVTTNDQYLEIGMVVDLYNSSGVSQGTKYKITDIDDNGDGTFDVTLDGASSITPAQDWYMTRHGSAGKEITGWSQVLNLNGDHDSLYGVTHKVWTPNVVAHNGSITETAMIKLTDLIRKRGGKTTVIFTTTGVRRAYFNLLTDTRRFVNTKEFDGGFSGLAFTTDKGEIPVVSDDDCPPGTMMFINEKDFKVYREGDWSWMDRDGSMWDRVVTSEGRFDMYQADLYSYFELGCSRRNSHGALTGVTEA